MRSPCIIVEDTPVFNMNLFLDGTFLSMNFHWQKMVFRDYAPPGYTDEEISQLTFC